MDVVNATRFQRAGECSVN